MPAGRCRRCRKPLDEDERGVCAACRSAREEEARAKPVVFRRAFEQRLTALATYFFLTWLGFLLSLGVAIPPLFVLEDTSVPKSIQGLIGLAIVLATFAFVLFRIVRSYRRRTCCELRIFDDRLERVRGKGVEAFPYEGVARAHFYRLPGGKIQRIEVHSPSGTIDLVSGEWPVEKIAPELERALVPALTRRTRAELEAGERVAFAEPSGWGVVSLAAGVLLLLVSLVMAVMLVAEIGDVRAFKLGKAAVLCGVVGGGLVWRFVATRGGGFALSATGLRRLREENSPEVPFEELSPVSVGADGVELDARDGQVFRLSPAGANFPVLLDLIRDRFPARARKRRRRTVREERPGEEDEAEGA